MRSTLLWSLATLATATALALLTTTVPPALPAAAQVCSPVRGPIPFGGPILLSQLCCNGLALTVGAPRPGYFMFQPGVSTLCPYGNITTPGTWVLGTATPGGFCLVPPFCLPLATKGTIVQIGTSGL